VESKKTAHRSPLLSIQPPAPVPARQEQDRKIIRRTTDRRECFMTISNRRLMAALFAASMLVPSMGRAEDLAARVATKLRDSGAMSGYRVSVRSEDKTIFLEGSVGTPKQIELAVVAAENTAGVERVVNRLTVVAAAQSSVKPKPAAGSAFGLSLPSSMVTLFSAPVKENEPTESRVQLTQATDADSKSEVA